VERQARKEKEYQRLILKERKECVLGKYQSTPGQGEI
jgi:hypothetical protein